EQVVDRGRGDVFLEEELDGVGDQRVDQPEAGEAEDRGPVGADPILDDGADLPLEEHAQGDHLQGEQDGEDRLAGRDRDVHAQGQVPARRSISSSARATVRFSWYSVLFTCRAGAVPQDARHSTSSREKRPSAVRSPSRMPSRCSTAVWIAPAPRSEQGRLRQSWMCQRPFGSFQYIV